MPKIKQDIDHNAMASGPARRGRQVKGRLWVEQDGETYLSWGRVVLLERIAEKGSVSAAAKSMGMSFSHAWKLVESMNRLSEQPLVVKQAGGKGGGGAWLSPEGRRAVSEFWALVKRFQGWVENQRP
ncbi:MAG: LysR family transcriptional regulator [Thermodesulfobacteriota bacterium]